MALPRPHGKSRVSDLFGPISKKVSRKNVFHSPVLYCCCYLVLFVVAIWYYSLLFVTICCYSQLFVAISLLGWPWLAWLASPRLVPARLSGQTVASREIWPDRCLAWGGALTIWVGAPQARQRSGQISLEATVCWGRGKSPYSHASGASPEQNPGGWAQGWLFAFWGGKLITCLPYSHAWFCPPLLQIIIYLSLFSGY